MERKDIRFFDVIGRTAGGLEVLFPGWQDKDERICVYSPHDDDASELGIETLGKDGHDVKVLNELPVNVQHFVGRGF